jgi:hypothetical protein
VKHAFAFLFFVFVSVYSQADWPVAPWLNGAPRPSAIVSAVAFVAPTDIQFVRMASLWKRLDKHYGALGVDFLIIAMKEPELPYSEAMIDETLKPLNYQLPVFLDPNNSYSKLWRAYVSPTVNLVLRNGKVTSFDPGNIDPATFEKTLQRILKENGVTGLPAREFTQEGEAKSCGHSHTAFLGDKYQKAFNPSPLTIDGSLISKPFWAASEQDSPWTMSFTIGRSAVAVLGTSDKNAKITVTLDGEKIPSDLRGHDVQEDKSGATVVTLHGPRLYEIISHSSRIKESDSKILFTGDDKPAKLWTVQTLPFCQE